jgi:beta-glucanase (GH16 family)
MLLGAEILVWGKAGVEADPPDPPSYTSGAASAAAITVSVLGANTGDAQYIAFTFKDASTQSLGGGTAAGWATLASVTDGSGIGRMVVLEKTYSATAAAGSVTLTAASAVSCAWAVAKVSGTRYAYTVGSSSWGEVVLAPEAFATSTANIRLDFVAPLVWPRTLSSQSAATVAAQTYSGDGPAIGIGYEAVSAGTSAAHGYSMSDPYTSTVTGDEWGALSVLLSTGTATGSTGGGTSTVAGFVFGSHQHGLGNSNLDRFSTGTFPTSTNTMEPFNYGPIRLHNVEMLMNYDEGHQRWWSGSNRTPGAVGGNSYNWSVLDAWTDKVFETRGHPIILTFFGMPRHAARLTNVTDQYGYIGGTSGPVNMTAWSEMVTDTIDHIVGRHGSSAIIAVEAWNEALGGGDNSTYSDFMNATGYPAANSLTALQTMYGDICRYTYEGVQASLIPGVRVLLGAQAYLNSGDLDFLFAVKSTANVSILEYGNAVSIHPYGTYDSSGAWSNKTVQDEYDAVSSRLSMAGKSTYQIWATEVGIHAPWEGTSNAWWSGLTHQQKADALYDWVGLYKSAGFKGLVSYSSDEDYQQPLGYDDGYIGSPGVSSQLIRDALNNAYRDFQGANVPDPVPDSTAPLGQNAADWVMTFEDHFDTGGLDSSKWTDRIWYGEIPDGNAGSNVGYPDGTINYDTNAGAFGVGNSTLRIYPKLNASGKFFPRTIHTDSAGGTTNDGGAKFLQKYGFFEARMKMPAGRGCWPAFWLFGHYDTPPVRPEIDIMECYSGGYDSTNGASPGWANSSLEPTVWGPNFWSDPGDEGYRTSTGVSMETPGDVLSDGFHVYGMKWESGGRMTWYYDGAQIGSTTVAFYDQLDTHSLAIYLDLWFGSASGWASVAETPTGTGNAFEIDYVRAWRAA